MKLNVRGRRKACPVSTSATLCVLMVALSLAAWPTHAYAEQSPTLTVHVTAGTSGSGSNNDSGQILPDNQRPASAGPGFIYELVQLDPALVTAVPGTQNERTRTILSHPNAYILGGAPRSLGESDADGDITNNGMVRQGSWISGGTISAGSIAGGSPAVLYGMQSNPTYWYIKLVYHPAGIVVQASEGSLVSLPYLSKGNDAGSLLVNYKVNVYPKTQACTQADEPAGTVSAAWSSQRNVLGFKVLATGATERAGSPRAVTRTRSAGFDACSGGVPDHGSSDQPSSFAATGAGVRKFALIVLVLTGVWLLIVVARDRKRAGGQSHNQRL